MVRGRYGYQPELPASPGAEGVGIVEAVGPGVQATIVGTRVVFIHMWNTWRERIVCPVDKLVPVPDSLDDAAAATSYTNPLTAWALTRSSHNLKEGDWLLQTAAASSVGKLVLQLAQQYRFKTINVIRRREQETIIRNLGGNEVICTADQDLTARLQELTAGKGVERAIDCVAGELGAEVARNLAPAGTGPREIHHAALCSAFDLFDSDGPRVVASALGEFPAARRSAGSDERSPHHVVERSTYAASDCAVFI
jgi:NADPH2:quinone reductase